MGKFIIFLVLLVGAGTAQADYERVLMGSCDVVGKDLQANFYVRNTDRRFSFDYVDSDGNVVIDTSVKHRQSMNTDDYGIKLKKAKVRMKTRYSFYKADFIFNTKKNTALFKHKRSYIREWRSRYMYVDRYKVKFENCNLDFSDVID